MKRNDNLILVRPHTKHGHEVVDRETGKTYFVKSLPDDLSPYEPLPIPGITLFKDRPKSFLDDLHKRRIEDVKAWRARKTRTTPSSRKTKAKGPSKKRTPKKIPGLDLAQEMLLSAKTPEDKAKWQDAINKIKASLGLEN